MKTIKWMLPAVAPCCSGAML